MIPGMDAPTSLPTALVCIDNADYCNYVQQTLAAIGYAVQTATTVDDAVVRIRVSTYEVVVIFAEMDGKPLEDNPVWEETLKIPLTNRRKQYIALISTTLPTRNEMVEFVFSVELIVNAADVANLGVLVRQGASSRQTSYALFHALSRPRALTKS